MLLAPRDRVANRHVVKYWSKYLTVIESPTLCRMLEPICEFGFARYRRDMHQYFTAIGETAKYNDIFSEWGERAPLLELAPEDIERGEAALRQLGLPEGARFVCFHSRDAGYSPVDEHWHSYRNASVENYLPAMMALYERGLYGMRMDDPTMPAMPAAEGLIDYARSPQRSDWMDVFLCARCEFFLGNSSGLYLISTAFGRPSALANLAPMSTALGGGPREIGIPKLLWHEEEARHLAFAEIFSSPVANYRFAEQYTAAGIIAQENDVEDVKALALEMLDRTRGVARYDSTDDDRQARFRALFRSGHYGYGSAAGVGRDFLRKYSHLLD
jgi:putative glycosyltransferase (TIGR04372 family)